MKAFGFTLVLSLLSIFSPGVWGDPPDIPWPEILPPRTWFFATMPDLEKVRETAKQSIWGKCFHDPEILRFLDSLPSKLPLQPLPPVSKELWSFCHKFSPRKIGFALVDGLPDPQFLMVASVEKSGRAVADWVEENYAQLTSSPFQNQCVFLTSGPDQIFHAFTLVGKTLLAASSYNLLQEVLDRYNKKTRGPFTLTCPQIQTRFPISGSPVLFAYLNVPECARPFEGMLPPLWKSMWEKAGISAIQHVAWGVHLEEKQIRVVVDLHIQGADQKLPCTGELDIPIILKSLPKDCTGFTSLNWEIVGLKQATRFSFLAKNCYEFSYFPREGGAFPHTIRVYALKSADTGDEAIRSTAQNSGRTLDELIYQSHTIYCCHPLQDPKTYGPTSMSAIFTNLCQGNWQEVFLGIQNRASNSETAFYLDRDKLYSASSPRVIQDFLDDGQSKGWQTDLSSHVAWQNVQPIPPRAGFVVYRDYRRNACAICETILSALYDYQDTISRTWGELPKQADFTMLPRGNVLTRYFPVFLAFGVAEAEGIAITACWTTD
jgi:hypothetical protein